METRKVQKIGLGTFTVSIPPDWAEAEGIEQGTEVGFHKHEGLLVLEVRGGGADDRYADEVCIDAPGMEAGSLTRLLDAAYSAGLREVGLTAPDPESIGEPQLRVIDCIAESLPGVATTARSDGGTTVSIVTDAEKMSMKKTVERLGRLTTCIHRRAAEALVGERADETILTEEREETERLYSMVDRSFKSGLSRFEEFEKLDVSRLRAFELWLTAGHMRVIADRSESIATSALEVERGRIEHEEEVAEIARMSQEVTEDCIGATATDDGDGPRRHLGALETRDEIYDRIDDLERRTVGASHRCLRILRDLRRIAEAVGRIAESGIQAAVRRGRTPERPEETEAEGSDDDELKTHGRE